MTLSMEQAQRVYLALLTASRTAKNARECERVLAMLRAISNEGKSE